MIRILHIVTKMNRGGLETFIMNVYRNINREKIQFDFLVHNNKEGDYDQEILELGGNIYYISPRNKGILKNKEELHNFFLEHNEYEVIHQHVSSLSYLAPLKVGKKAGIKNRIVHSHSSKLSGKKINLFFHYLNQRKIENIATHKFACSDLAAKWLYGSKISNENKYQLVYNGVDLDLYNFNVKGREIIRKELAIKEETLVIGHVGRFSYPKNHIYLIDVFHEILKKDRNVLLVLVGDGELKDEINKKIIEYGITENVKMLGVRSDIPDLLSAMDILLFPSHYEGLPVTLVEAQASGLKCLVSNKITKQIKITENLEFMNINDDPEKWADSVLKNKNYYRRKQNINLSLKKFEIKVVAKDLENFYLKITQNARGEIE